MQRSEILGGLHDMALPTRGRRLRTLVLVLLVPLGLTLGGCGEVVSPLPGSTGAKAPRSGEASDGRQPLTGAPSDLPAGSTTAPSEPAPESFVERAKAVAAAVRKAGLPEQPAGPTLLGPWAVDLSFETDAQKVAWSAGRVTLGARIPKDEIGVSSMRLPDGTERPVDVLSPRDAMARALEGAEGDCSGIPPSECQLTLTGATLTTARVPTTAGEATVPAWSFTATGLARPLVVVATAPGVLEPPQPSATPPALPPASPGLSSADALADVSGETITVQLGHGACDRDLAGHAVEFPDLVVVGGTFTPPDPGTMCTMQYLLTPTVLHLAKPLGDRLVIDIASGSPRYLGVPAS
ncbi:hypothetical protein [Intrasporangium calvum]|uniref:hypothetical protein n=1 Tax=Intrasporangium calvum TaxID=53358 RepID=UPI000DF5E1F9|nr:hypothetical protein [Intrasporangium calvum]AXG12402.1 hypothetical protein DN585_02230 [Intrasporangium calvum]